MVSRSVPLDGAAAKQKIVLRVLAPVGASGYRGHARQGAAVSAERTEST
jgi:hypothetical protein